MFEVFIQRNNGTVQRAPAGYQCHLGLNEQQKLMVRLVWDRRNEGYARPGVASLEWVAETVPLMDSVMLTRSGGPGDKERRAVFNALVVEVLVTAGEVTLAASVDESAARLMDGAVPLGTVESAPAPAPAAAPEGVLL